jgi:hypothetical protein
MSLRPTIPNDVPVETARVARAAFPHGSLLLSLRGELGPSSTTSASPPYSRVSVSAPRHPGAWFLLPCSSSPSACLTGRRPMPCAV